MNYKRLKHLDLRIHSLRERHENGQILGYWISGDLNLADIGTKPLAGPRFRKLRDTIFGAIPIVIPRPSAGQNKKEYEQEAYKEAYRRLTEMLRTRS